ncbi:hypothetical protein BGX38DRAFT_1215191 [Terfezia claveryi]|nr:hypothetical protein BGX38DRAFT_1215191 [Terfezia claveryi]
MLKLSYIQTCKRTCQGTRSIAAYRIGSPTHPPRKPTAGQGKKTPPCNTTAGESDKSPSQQDLSIPIAPWNQPTSLTSASTGHQPLQPAY